jgi:hypothetical protein
MMRLGMLVFVAVAGAGMHFGQQNGAVGTPRNATIVGTVEESGRKPIQGAVVAWRGNSGELGAPVITDSHGRFVFRNVPVEGVSLWASRPGYLGGYFGQRFELDASQTLDLHPNELLTKVVLRLWKAAIISGTITDDKSEPLPGVEVQAFRRSVVGGRPRFVAASSSLTNDRGQYRISRLIAGDYIVAAPASVEPASAGQPVGHGSVFFPSSVLPGNALTVSIESGEERSGIDFILEMTGLFKISGRILGLDSNRLPVPINLVQASDVEPSLDLQLNKAEVLPDGTFTFRSVPPGQYAIRVVSFSRPRPSLVGVLPTYQTGAGTTWAGGGLRQGGSRLQVVPEEPTLWAQVPVSVDDRDVHDLVIGLREAGRIAGRVVPESGAPLPGLTGLPVLVQSADGRALGTFPVAGLDRDGNFQTVGLLPGRYVLWLPSLPPGWRISGITGPEVPPGSESISLGENDVHSVRVSVTDHDTEIHGTVTGPDNNPSSLASIYIFPQNQLLWQDCGPFPLRIRQVRPATSGIYRAVGLPPADYFVVASIRDVREQWMAPEFLALLSRNATRVRLSAGDRLLVDLKARR